MADSKPSLEMPRENKWSASVCMSPEVSMMLSTESHEQSRDLRIASQALRVLLSEFDRVAAVARRRSSASQPSCKRGGLTMPAHIERDTTLVVALSNNGREIERDLA